MTTRRTTQSLEPRDELQSVLDRLVGGRGRLIVLEAGCGSSTHVTLPTDVNIVGIDISPEQLEKNKYSKEKILGDVQTYDFDKESFDLIICWDVLEHLPNPRNALKSFVRAAKPNGVILLALPNVYSLKGLITKFTPHWFHVWVYQHIYGNENAGKSGFTPFETFLRPSISAGALRRFAHENGLIEEFTCLYESSMVTGLKNRSKFLYAGYRATLWLLRVISLGTYDGAKSDIFIVLQKPMD